MDTGEKCREQISALADGELDEADIEATFSSLSHGEGAEDWRLYHQIGDILRSEDMAISLSPGFAARLNARLEQEPIIIAPSAIVPSALAEKRNTGRRWIFPGIAAAVMVAVVAAVNVAHFMEGEKGQNALASSKSDEGVQAVVSQVPSSMVLRDPRIDDYLLAHQRFSPSVYSTAQYARSATFDADSSK